MDYGRIISRAWKITWRYRALWILGIFAGISGCQASGGSSGHGSGDFSLPDGSTVSRDWSGDLGSVARHAEQWLPLLVAGIGLLVILGIVWMVLHVAARGGLVVGANAAEEDRRLSLGTLWGSGFGRFWPLVGVDLLLRFPVFVAGLVLLVAIVVPILGLVAGGGQPDSAMVVPVCGSLAIGLPALFVFAAVLDMLHPLAERYVVLGVQGPLQATGNAWRFFRARFKHTFLMWLLSGALNLAVEFIVAAVVVALVLVFAVPAGMTALSSMYGVAWGLAGIGILLLIVVLVLFSGVWGTFSSALWTMFFRDVTGMSAPAAQAPVEPQPAVTPLSEAPLPSGPPIAPPPSAPMSGD